MDSINKVLIVGGGISGLTVAYALKKRGIKVKILERSSHVGGVINTVCENGFRAESGSNSIMVQSQKTLDFFKEIGIEDRIIYSNPIAKKRFFVKDGSPCEVPMSPPKMFASRLFSLRAKIRLLFEMKIKKFDAESEPSVAEFTKKRLGQEALDYGMNPFMAGIYGGDPERLSIKYAFPPFWNLEQKYGSIIKGAMKARKEKISAGNFFKPVIVSFKNGLCELTDRLFEILKDDIVADAKFLNIDYIQHGWNVSWITKNLEEYESFDRMILALPSRDILNLPISGTLWQKLSEVGKIEYAPVVSITMGFKREDVLHPLDGFGILVPEKEKEFNVLGALFVSTLFENRAPSDCVTITCYLGGVRNPELIKKSDAELDILMLKDLKKLIGLKSENYIFKRIFRWENGIAQYNLGYGKILDSIDDAEREFPNMRLLGAYRGGVGVSSCIENALKLGEDFDV